MRSSAGQEIFNEKIVMSKRGLRDKANECICWAFVRPWFKQNNKKIYETFRENSKINWALDGIKQLSLILLGLLMTFVLLFKMSYMLDMPKEISTVEMQRYQNLFKTLPKVKVEWGRVNSRILMVLEVNCGYRLGHYTILIL